MAAQICDWSFGSVVCCLGCHWDIVEASVSQPMESCGCAQAASAAPHDNRSLRRQAEPVPGFCLDCLSLLFPLSLSLLALPSWSHLHSYLSAIVCILWSDQFYCVYCSYGLCLSWNTASRLLRVMCVLLKWIIAFQPQSTHIVDMASLFSNALRVRSMYVSSFIYSYRVTSFLLHGWFNVLYLVDAYVLLFGNCLLYVIEWNFIHSDNLLWCLFLICFLLIPHDKTAHRIWCMTSMYSHHPGACVSYS